ncbi:MAG TPA: alcohol dehydrogenase catalytic domain-containing protein, partial [Planctomycetota bacterium]|nr:alcohol dehydrogenase catalytic domain-containing protein [Planctomycetota bacterium]
MNIRAAILHSIGHPAPYAQSRPLRIERVELDPPGPGEVLVKLIAAGLCHSDLSVINGDRPRPVPMVLGHEASAEVVEVGAGVSEFEAGDLVVLVFVPSCGHCIPCAEGRPALCEPALASNVRGTLISGERRLRFAQADSGRQECRPSNGALHHLLGVAAFADHAVVSQNSCVKIGASGGQKDSRSLAVAARSFSTDPVEAALFGCAVLTGVGAVINTARVQAGSTVAVVGLGGVGLCALLGALAAGAREVIAVDVHESKLNAAKSLGATATVNASASDAVEQVKA